MYMRMVDLHASVLCLWLRYIYMLVATAIDEHLGTVVEVYVQSLRFTYSHVRI